MKKEFILMAVTLFLLQCGDVGDGRSVTNATYHRGIGSSISLTIAKQWISNCIHKQSSSSHKEKEAQHFALNHIALKEALSVSQNVIGATFQNAIDADGFHHILFVPFVEGLPFRNDVAPVIDMATGAIVSSAMSQQWTSAYRLINPNSIRYYFFGLDVLNEILSIDSFTELEAIQGLTNEGEYRLVLLVHQNNSFETGRSNAVDPIAYDNSSPCPNTCADL